jgi:hypothetical protein
MTTQNHASTPVESGYVPVNGLEMYYEIHGSGRPLVLLHGNLSTIGTSFGKMLLLTESFAVTTESSQAPLQVDLPE